MRSAGILVENEKVAVMKRERESLIYYLFPGGQVEQNETPEQAVKREILEELGLYVEVERLVATVAFQGRKQYYFLVSKVNGEFGTGLGEELKSSKDSEDGAYLPEWLPIYDLVNYQIKPQAIVNLLVNSMMMGWPEKAITYEEL